LLPEFSVIYRGEMLSAFYYIADSKRSESGVFVLHKMGEMFRGVYAQYLLSFGMKLYQSDLAQAEQPDEVVQV